ncbi:ThuA domain-containing protein [Aquisphaera insulae]|uniref:ThuA domain-containing protein n=1 Tax=Aquisphaera insulae TaxID=2712864 RepID=UPI0013EDB92A|nr:ThuA domain-containing protein [Aquisphaera insulae]
MATKTSRIAALAACLWVSSAFGQPTPAPTAPPRYKVLAVYTGKDDLAHVSFVKEARAWFARMAAEHHFAFESTTDWDRLSAESLAPYRVVVFLDTRPESPKQRAAFRKYMEDGGGWMGFHFAAFALTPSKYPQDWGWYHDDFLGSGSYVSNTWRPTSAVLRVEDSHHPATANLPATFKSSPNEWYRWSRDLRKNKDIKILASIDPSSFPLGTGPKKHEIWHEGDYPVAWTNQKYRMIYFNMGHNDLDHATRPPKDLSSTFASEPQSRMILNALEWLGTSDKPATDTPAKARRN